MSSQPVPGHLRVLIVDPDRRVRHSLSTLICCVSDRVDVVGEADDAATALELAAALHPHVVMLDPRLPEVDAGLALVGELRARWPQLRIIVMGWADSLEYPALARGADSFVGKSAGPNEFLEAIRSAWALAA